MGLLDNLVCLLNIFVGELDAVVSFGELAAGSGELGLGGLAEGGE